MPHETMPFKTSSQWEVVVDQEGHVVSLPGNTDLCSSEVKDKSCAYNFMFIHQDVLYRIFSTGIIRAAVPEFAGTPLYVLSSVNIAAVIFEFTVAVIRPWEQDGVFSAVFPREYGRYYLHSGSLSVFTPDSIITTTNTRGILRLTPEELGATVIRNAYNSALWAHHNCGGDPVYIFGKRTKAAYRITDGGDISGNSPKYSEIPFTAADERNFNLDFNKSWSWSFWISDCGPYLSHSEDECASPPQYMLDCQGRIGEIPHLAFSLDGMRRYFIYNKKVCLIQGPNIFRAQGIDQAESLVQSGDYAIAYTCGSIFGLRYHHTKEIEVKYLFPACIYSRYYVDHCGTFSKTKICGNSIIIEYVLGERRGKLEAACALVDPIKFQESVINISLENGYIVLQTSNSDFKIHLETTVLEKIKSSKPATHTSVIFEEEAKYMLKVFKSVAKSARKV